MFTVEAAKDAFPERVGAKPGGANTGKIITINIFYINIYIIYLIWNFKKFNIFINLLIKIKFEIK